MRRQNLDAFERGVERSAGAYRPVSGAARRRIEAVLDTERKTRNINIRISNGDLGRIRALSSQEGLPYQTLISSVLHKYVTHQLVDEKNVLRAVELVR
jgi:hypothetical protein